MSIPGERFCRLPETRYHPYHQIGKSSIHKNLLDLNVLADTRLPDVSVDPGELGQAMKEVVLDMLRKGRFNEE